MSTRLRISDDVVAAVRAAIDRAVPTDQDRFETGAELLSRDCDLIEVDSLVTDDLYVGDVRAVRTAYRRRAAG